MAIIIIIIIIIIILLLLLLSIGKFNYKQRKRGRKIHFTTLPNIFFLIIFIIIIIIIIIIAIQNSELREKLRYVCEKQKTNS